VVDRKKDVVIMSGWKIYPKEVEEALLKHREIKEAAVFARADELRGEVPGCRS
jgi:long-chain acyl-CoA synthetase